MTITASPARVINSFAPISASFSTITTSVAQISTYPYPDVASLSTMYLTNNKYYPREIGLFSVTASVLPTTTGFTFTAVQLVRVTGAAVTTTQAHFPNPGWGNLLDMTVSADIWIPDVNTYVMLQAGTDAFSVTAQVSFSIRRVA